jgi:hypothetical protein
MPEEAPVKFHLLVNTGSSMHGIETVEFPDEVWQYVEDRYNATAGGTTVASVFANTRIGETLESAVHEPAPWADLHLAAVMYLATLNRALSQHHAATLEVERTA